MCVVTQTTVFWMGLVRKETMQGRHETLEDPGNQTVPQYYNDEIEASGQKTVGS